MGPFSERVFGHNLDELMQIQAKTHPDLTVPHILVLLTTMLRELQGTQILFLQVLMVNIYLVRFYDRRYISSLSG